LADTLKKKQEELIAFQKEHSVNDPNPNKTTAVA
jgi:hypothetical protein